MAFQWQIAHFSDNGKMAMADEFLQEFMFLRFNTIYT